MNPTEKHCSSDRERIGDKYERLSQLFAYGEEIKELEGKKKKLLEQLGESYYHQKDKEAAAIVRELERIKSEINDKSRKTEELSDAL